MKIVHTFLMLCGCFLLAACGDEREQVVIYSNADDEVILTLKEVLDEKGYKGDYVIQSFGSGDLMGKLMAEGESTQADIITFSTFYLESLIDISPGLLKAPDIDQRQYLPQYQHELYVTMLSNPGAIFANEAKLKELGLPIPTSLKELANPIYKGQISIPNLAESTTGWLIWLGILDSYNAQEASQIRDGILANVGIHFESSGSTPIKKVESGEVAIGFGLRHQGVEKRHSGLPIAVIDPIEGSYSNNEAYALLDDANPLTKTIFSTMVKEAATPLLDYYPVPVRQGDQVKEDQLPKLNTFSQKRTKALLDKHIMFVNGK